MNKDIPYFKGADGRLSAMANPDAVTIPYRTVAGIRYAINEAADALDRRGDAQNAIIDEGERNKYELAEFNLKAELDQFKLDNPNNFDAWAKKASDIASRAGSMQMQFSDPQRQIQFEGRRELFARNIITDTEKDISRGRLTEARASFDANIQRLQDINDYQGVLAEIKKGTGILFNSDEANLMQTRTVRAETMHNWSKVNAENPVEAGRILETTDIRSKLSPKEWTQLQRENKASLTELYNNTKLGYAQQEYDGMPATLEQINNDLKSGRIQPDDAIAFRESAFRNDYIKRLYDGNPMTGDELKMAVDGGMISREEAIKYQSDLAARGKAAQKELAERLKYYNDPSAYNSVENGLINYDPSEDQGGREYSRMLQLIGSSQLADETKKQFISDLNSLRDGKTVERLSGPYAQFSSIVNDMSDRGYFIKWKTEDPITGKDIPDFNKLRKAETLKRQLLDSGRRYINKHPDATQEELVNYVEREAGRLKAGDSAVKSQDSMPVPMEAEPGITSDNVLRDLSAQPSSYTDWLQSADMEKPVSVLQQEAGSLFRPKTTEEAKEINRAIQRQWWNSRAPGEKTPSADLGKAGRVLPAGLKDFAGDFIEIGNKYGVDPNLLMAISMHETGGGTSSAFRNKRNAMGVSNSKGPISFDSVRESIDYMAKRLKENYIDQGLTDIPSIGAKYAPVGAGNDPGNLNRHWAAGVTKYYNQLNA